MSEESIEKQIEQSAAAMAFAISKLTEKLGDLNDKIDQLIDKLSRI